MANVREMAGAASMQATNGKSILCPYCCKRFPARDAHFKLNSPLDIKVEEVTDNDEDELSMGIRRRRGSDSKSSENTQGKVLDERLYQYYKSIYNDEAGARTAAMNYGFVEFKTVDPAIQYNRQSLAQFGYVNSINYHGQELSTRLCPYCHMEVVQSAGKYDMYMISVIGDTAVGKSIYLAVLQVMIERGQFNASMMFMGTKQEKEHYLSVKKKVVTEQVGLEATIGRVPPLTFQLTYDKPDSHSGNGRESVLITFCDIAGEMCRDSENLKIYGNHLKASDGLMFLVDPTRFSRVKNNIDENVNIGNEYQLDVVAAINQFLVSGTYDTHSDIPAAVMVTKSDVLKELPYFAQSSKKMELLTSPNWNDVHAGFLNEDEIMRVNQEVTDFLGDMGELDFTRKMGDLFRSYSFFINSALGHSLQKDDDDDMDDAQELYRRGNISPYRVTEAFYWILAENNLIPRKLIQKYRNDKTGEEKVISTYYYKNEDRLYINKKIEAMKEAQGIKNGALTFLSGKWILVEETHS